MADLLQAWVDETDIDGFNLAYVLAHDTFADVVAFLIPELQKRGVYATEYREGTFRDKLFGAGPLLPADNCAARFRDIRSVIREQASLRPPVQASEADVACAEPLAEGQADAEAQEDAHATA